MPGKRGQKAGATQAAKPAKRKGRVRSEQPGLNGHADARPAIPDVVSAPPDDDDYTGTARFCEGDIQQAEWYWKPWIARGIYTLLVGLPSSGKSTFGAFLARRARKTLILPGEEDIRRVVLPRLRASGIRLENVLFAPASEHWVFPRSRERLVRLIEKEGVDFVLVDPVDSYTEGATDEDKNMPVRRFLDVFSQTAEQTGCAMVLVRHPGKAKDNLLAGSRAWRSHPRAILQMGMLPDDRYKGVLEPFKAPLGCWTDPHYYRLQGLDEEPKEFSLAGPAPLGHVREAQDVTDHMERHKIDEAERFLKKLLEGGVKRVSVELYKLAEAERFSERTLRYAAQRLGVRKDWSGCRETLECRWSLPPKNEDRPEAGPA